MGHCDRIFVTDADKIYHDSEWGTPVRDDDRQMFEHLTLECLQCGLSWGLILKKREIFRACFANFDFNAIAGFDDADVERILSTEGMLRAPHKIHAIINNARCCQKLCEEFGSFCEYLWAYTDGKIIVYDGHAEGNIPASNGLSARIAKDLKKHGFKYVGPITIYSHLQACGLVNDHASDCPRFAEINGASPTASLTPDDEPPLP